MSSISHKFNSLLGGQLDKQQQQAGGEPNQHYDRSKAIVLYNNKAMANESYPTSLYENLAEEEEEGEESHDHKYPELTHPLFESVDDQGGEEELLDENGGNETSVIDLVRNSKEEEGENFRLEDEIDHVADLFIRRFHQQMRMQKQESFKRYQEMLQRSV